MITYTTGTSSIRAGQLDGFFDGWEDPPSANTHLKILLSSSHVVIARDNNEIVGFANAISDGVLAACIPLCEVRREWRGHGIGSELITRLLEQLADYYMIDLVCDPETLGFYKRLGFQPGSAAIMRNYARQTGRR